MKPSWFAQPRYRPGRCRWAFIAALLFIGVSPAGAQEQLIKLRVGLGDVSLNKLPFVAAYEAEILKKERPRCRTVHHSERRRCRTANRYYRPQRIDPCWRAGHSGGNRRRQSTDGS